MLSCPATVEVLHIDEVQMYQGKERQQPIQEQMNNESTIMAIVLRQ